MRVSHLRIVPDLTRGSSVESWPARSSNRSNPSGDGVPTVPIGRVGSVRSDLEHGRNGAAKREKFNWLDLTFWTGVYLLWLAVAYVLAWSMIEAWS